LVLQASLGDGVSFDPFPLFDDGLSPPKVNVRGRQVLNALVVALVIVVIDEGIDLGFERTRQVVVLQQDGLFSTTLDNVMAVIAWLYVPSLN